MTTSERKLADVQGEFTQVITDGRKNNDVTWMSGRFILSDRRLIIVGNGGKRTIPLSEIDTIGDRFDVNQAIATVSGYVSLQLGSDVILVSPNEESNFRTALHKALLDREVILVKHPAVRGGVVTDAGWQKARLSIESDAVNLALQSGSLVTIDRDDIGTVERTEKTVKSDTRPVIDVEHSEEGTSLRTYLSGTERHCSIIETVLEEGARQNRTELDLSKNEKEVLVALYSGVAPFDIPDFLGLPVEDVEETFERLVDLEVLEEIRIRREVALNARGRNIASEAMNDAEG